MAPPRNVTGGGIKNAAPAENLKSTPSTDVPPNSKSLASSLSTVPSVAPSGRQIIDEEGVVRVLLHRYGGAPLGFTIEGGSDTHLKYVYIQSLSVGSPASNSGLFSKGDQIVMVGEKCLVGTTYQEARKVLDTAPSSVEIVAQRKQSPKQVPKHSIPEIRSSEASRSHSGSETDIPNAASANSKKDLSIPVEEPPPSINTVPEETMTIVLQRTPSEKLGLSIVGGSDNPNLPQVHVSSAAEFYVCTFLFQF